MAHLNVPFGIQFLDGNFQKIGKTDCNVI